MFGIPFTLEIVSGVKVKFIPARFTWPLWKCRTNRWANSWWCWVREIISKYWKHDWHWKQSIASGHACNWVKEVGSSLTCLPLLWDLLGTLSSVDESLSCSYPCSYGESVSDMVLKCVCQLYAWLVRKWAISVFVSMPNVSHIIRCYRKYHSGKRTVKWVLSVKTATVWLYGD